MQGMFFILFILIEQSFLFSIDTTLLIFLFGRLVITHGLNPCLAAAANSPNLQKEGLDLWVYSNQVDRAALVTQHVKSSAPLLESKPWLIKFKISCFDFKQIIDSFTSFLIQYYKASLLIAEKMQSSKLKWGKMIVVNSTKEQKVLQHCRTSMLFNLEMCYLSSCESQW